MAAVPPAPGPAGQRGQPGVREGVLLLADSQEWEAAALEHLRGSRAYVVARRCLDAADLMALATTGEARLAVAAGDASGFDAACVAHLAAHGVAAVAVAPAGLGAVRAWTPPRGTAGVVGEDLAGLDAALRSALHDLDQRTSPPREAEPSPDPAPAAARKPLPEPDATGAASGPAGRAICVWGPVGAPGRTTVALALAGELSARGRRTTLLDVDAWGGTVGQHLGILNEVSGLLAAARAAAGDTLTSERLADLCVAVGSRLKVLTGLPAPDRWPEVGAGTVERILEAARERGDVIIDAGPSLDAAVLGGWGGRPPREHLATEAAAAADLVVLVGAADPVGLTRLVRGAAELAEVRPEGPDLVVLNRMRPTLGWSDDQVLDLVRRAVPEAPVVTLPEDRAGVDRALAEGSLLVESAPGPLRATVRDLVEDRLLALLGAGGASADAAARAGRGGSWRARLTPRRGAPDPPR